MKRYLSFLLVLLLVVGAGLTGCGNDTTEPQQEETPPVQTEISTLKGEYQGLADGHSVEIIVDGEAQVYQFYDEEIGSVLESMETGALVQFDVETDSETEVSTIVKVYDEPAQG
ncbi:MAG: hypothetical protein ACLUKQ_03785 [Peptococcaceae bacterium]